MAMATTIVCPQNITGAVVRSPSMTKKRMNKVVHVRGLEELKAKNNLRSLGVPLSADKCFAKIVSSVKGTKGKRGGALTTTCNAASEIFTIAAIMNGLVLIGVAVGFLLLRIEAWVEESEAE